MAVDPLHRYSNEVERAKTFMAVSTKIFQVFQGLTHNSAGQGLMSLCYRYKS